MEQWQIQDFPEGGTKSQTSVILQFFCQKLHENERIWCPRGARVAGAPLGSANVDGYAVGAWGWRWVVPFSLQFEPYFFA